MNEITIGFLKMRDHYLSNAEKMMRSNNFRKAGEMLWGSAAQEIKAVASIRNISLGSHKQFYAFMEEIRKARGDSRTYELFEYINMLHVNFYDEVIPKEKFQSYYAKVLTFIEEMNKIMRNIN